MAQANSSVKINIEADSQSALSAIKQAEQAIRQFAASLGAVDGTASSAAMDAVATAAQKAADQLAAISEASESAGASAEEAGGGIDDLAGNVNDAVTAADSASLSFVNLKGAIATLALGKVASDFIRLNSEFEATEKALSSVLGSVEAAGEGMAYTGALADRLGLSASELAKQFVDLAAATKGAALEGQATRDIFEAVVGAMGSLGKSSADTANALKAVSQMASKGVVNAEEMRGQLGEALPGAMQALSDATGITVKDLNEMMEAGTLLAADVLPALAKGLNDTFGSENAQQVDTLGASVERLQNALQRAFTEPGQNGLAEPFKAVINGATSAVNGLTAGTVTLGKNIGATAAYAAGAIPDWDAYTAAIAENNAAGQAYIDGDVGIQQATNASATALQSLSATALEAAKTHTQHAAAATESATTIKKQGEAAIGAAQANLEFAKLSGDVAAALQAEAAAAEASAAAKRNDADAAAAIVAETNRYLAVLQQQVAELEKLKAAEGAETEQVQARIDAIKAQIETLGKSQEQQQATADAAVALADKQALANAQARLAVETHGDQSAALDGLKTNMESLRANLDQARDSLASLTETERAGKEAAAELALIHELQKSNLERLNGARGQSLPVMQAVAAESDRLAVREKELTTQIESGRLASEGVAAARAAETEAAARLAESLTGLRGAQAAARAELASLEAAERAGKEAAEELAQVHERQKTNLERLNGARGQSLPVMQAVAAESDRLAEREKDLTAQIEAGKAASEKIAKARQTEAEITAKVSDALADLTKKREFEQQQAERNTNTIEAEGKLRLDHLRNLKNEAEARGDMAGAMQIEAQIRRAEIEILRQTLAAKQAEVVAAQAAAAAKLQEADADGIRTQAELAGIATANEAVATKQREVAAIQEAIRAKQAEAQTAGQVADSVNKVADATDKVERSTRKGGESASYLAGELKKLGIESEYAALAQETANAAYMEAAAVTQKWADEMGATQGKLNGMSAVAMVNTDAYIKRLQEQEKIALEAAQAAVAHAKAVDELAARQAGLTKQLDAGNIGLAEYIEKLQRAAGVSGKLGEEDLADLRDAIADAREKMDDFADSARDGLSDLQQEWAELNGQQIQAAILEQQMERLKLEAELAQAKRDGNTEAIAALQAQLVLLDQIHAKQLQMLADEEAARAIKAAEDAAAEAERRAGLSDEARQYEDTINALKAQLANAIKAQDAALQASILAQIEAEKRRHEQALANIDKETKAREDLNKTAAKLPPVGASATPPASAGNTVTATAPQPAVAVSPSVSTKTVRLQIDGAELFGDERHVNAFLSALEKAGLRAL